jgi:hypothetical protein
MQREGALRGSRNAQAGSQAPAPVHKEDVMTLSELVQRSLRLQEDSDSEEAVKDAREAMKALARGKEKEAIDLLNRASWMSA